MRILVFVLGASLLAASDEAEFFERKIRPLLATNCHACHTEGALGGLRLDSREGLLKGGKSGAAVVPGKPEDSLLMQAVRRTHIRLKMPPVGALKETEVADLAEWIRAGVLWPETAEKATATQTRITPQQRAFWSFQPLKAVAPPAVKDTAWVRGDIDRFILARLEAAKLSPAKPAAARAWLRRVTLDLTGLPPTPEEADRYAAGSSPRAQAAVVDRLLASPHYGERWARHWLDLARYSDGELAASVDTPLPNAWRYRDWVVDALNRDLPYPLFVKAQIAADLLPEAKDHRAGLGFQALGETANDRVDVTTKVFLGLTVGCAQCHDHKYDPIPTKDYYSLLGIFSSTKNHQFPLVPAAEVDRYQSQKKKIDALKETLNDYLAEQTKQLVDLLARDTARYLMAAYRQETEVSGLDTETLGRWKKYLAATDNDHAFLKPWQTLVAGKPTLAQVEAEAARYQQFILDLLDEAKEVDDKNYVAFGGRKGQKNENTRQYTNIVSLPVLKFYQWREIAYGPYNIDGFKAPAGVLYYGPKEITRFLGGIAKSYVDKLNGEIAALEKDLPPMYPFVHAVTEADQPADVKVALRGDPKTPGEVAPRRFLQVLCEGEPAFYTKGSGRAELARAIVEHPLAARVIVNRVWQHHFGKGLVRTPSNFGRMGERPTHPELLDYLAVKFVEHGWSLKWLHREILLSNTYSQATGASPEADANNQLLSHFPRAPRLDMEALRDSVLAVSGQLDATVGGAPEPLTDTHRRRALYLTVSRTRLDPALALFDFPDPNISTDDRPTTSGPLQGLYWLNSPFVAKQAAKLNERLLREAGSLPAARITRAYHLLYGRPPDAEELQLGQEYVASGDASWPPYLRALLGATEFSSVN
ncbi:MAG: PSD1 and planctomycete cytochrome C domain-containing protein [Bryobacteraceae bacterium]|nr:PSD1 and planctomycete cytochrome C domain-containing protein [Bryobacteraceae bacterium]